MTRSAIATITFIFVICSFAFAQDSTPKVQVFGGYSLLHEDAGRLTGIALDLDLRQFPNTFGVKSNFNGWNAEAQYNFGPWVAVAADVSGYPSSPIFVESQSTVSGLPKGSSYSILVGPVISYRKMKKITPFVHALFGWDRTSLGASTLTGTSFPVSTTATAYNDFTMALGGGVDYKLSHRFALRVAQLDWYHTSLNLNSFYGSVFSSSLFQGLATREKNLRFSAGIVVNF
ncbi:MAG: outer membrane beta-barrel protein [Acidobacteriaceae bacterium]